jgi:hypothetical protein
MDKRYLIAWAGDCSYSWDALSNFLDDRPLECLNQDCRWKQPVQSRDALSVMEFNDRKAAAGEEPRLRLTTLPTGEAELGRVLITQDDYGMKRRALNAGFSRFRQRPTFGLLQSGRRIEPMVDVEELWNQRRNSSREGQPQAKNSGETAQ